MVAFHARQAADNPNPNLNLPNQLELWELLHVYMNALFSTDL